jgi:hypothetical protein
MYNKLTLWSRVLEEPTTVQLVKKFFTIHETRRFISYSKEPVTASYPEPAESSPHSYSHAFLRSILILSSQLCRIFPSGVFLSDLNSSIFPVHSTYHNHLILLDLIIIIQGLGLLTRSETINMSCLPF